jgi:hypothetical protein
MENKWNGMELNKLQYQSEQYIIHDTHSHGYVRRIQSRYSVTLQASLQLSLLTLDTVFYIISSLNCQYFKPCQT